MIRPVDSLFAGLVLATAVPFFVGAPAWAAVTGCDSAGRCSAPALVPAEADHLRRLRDNDEDGNARPPRAQGDIRRADQDS